MIHIPLVCTRHQGGGAPVVFPSIAIYDKVAPTRVGAVHGPSLVLILCADPVSGFTHAASRVDSVMKPNT